MWYFLLSLLCLSFTTGTVNATVYKKWETICESGCSSFTTSKASIFPDGSPFLILLKFDPNEQLIVSALSTEEIHYSTFTNKAPVELKRGSVNYVPARDFFNTRFSATLLVDGTTISSLLAIDESHIGGATSSALIDAFRRGSTAELIYASGYRGKGQRVSFSLIGFSAALAARTSPKEFETTAIEDPIGLISEHLSGNRYGLGSQNLKAALNPHGDGVFVYIPELEIAGYKRRFFWFVKGNEAVALNGATKDMTPKLPSPLDTSYKLWSETGMSNQDVTERGQDLIFTP